MSFDRLLKDGKIKPFRATKEEIERSIELAERDLEVAAKMLSDSPDWALSIAYNAVIQASRAYMFHAGYRPAAHEAHKSTLEFMEIALGESMQETVSYFDRMRRKRHRAVYEQVGVVSEGEVVKLLELARDYVAEIKRRIGDF